MNEKKLISAIKRIEYHCRILSSNKEDNDEFISKKKVIKLVKKYSKKD